MQQLTEDYVSVETAKLLKEKGFDVPCYKVYVPTNKDYQIRDDSGHSNSQWKEFDEVDGVQRFSAPTLQIVCKWLRELYNIFVIVDTNERVPSSGRYYWCRIYYSCINKVEIMYYMNPDNPNIVCYYKTYEEAQEAGIKYALKNFSSMATSF